jgi:hypothetical protein
VAAGTQGQGYSADRTGEKMVVDQGRGEGMDRGGGFERHLGGT